MAVDAGEAVGPVERPWRPMIGAEHLSQLEAGVGPGGRPIGAEFAEALRRAHVELGVEAVRSHAILDDDLGTYREVDGRPVHDFTGIDRIYDRVMALGLRPIVELSFMPRDLASDPSKTVFDYGAIVSPPKDWDRWEGLIRELTAHLVERYGLDEVRRWAFEVWNEANLDVFWSGTRDEYMRLYDVSVRAVKAVDGQLIVGGPASAAGKWVDEMLAHCRATGSPIDFVSTHTYGNAPLDLRPIAARHGYPGLPQWWTEWGAHASHFNPVHDSPWSAAYLVRGMASAMGRTEALAYWTVSDHFEELGRPPRLLHGGFGLLAVGNLRKPRWWGLWMLEQLLPDAAGHHGHRRRRGRHGPGNRLASRRRARHDRGLERHRGRYEGRRRADPRSLGLADRLGPRGSGSIAFAIDAWTRRTRTWSPAWAELGGVADWPDEAQWTELAARDRLEDLEPEQVDGGAGWIARPCLRAADAIGLAPGARAGLRHCRCATGDVPFVDEQRRARSAAGQPARRSAGERTPHAAGRRTGNRSPLLAAWAGRRRAAGGRRREAAPKRRSRRCDAVAGAGSRSARC